MSPELNEYDSLSRLTRVDGPLEHDVIAYEYDALGNRLKMSYPEVDPAGNPQERQIIYTYDALSRLDSVTDPDAKVTRYTYDSLGNLATTALPNKAQNIYTYDAMSRPTAIRVRRLNRVLSAFTYEYNLSGMRTKATSEERLGARDVNYSLYTYDDLNQLTAEQRYRSAGQLRYSFAYTYDAVGNRLTSEHEIAPSLMYLRGLPAKANLRYAYNQNNQLIQLITERIHDDGSLTSMPLTTYGYDANGNLASEQKTNSRGGSAENIYYTYDYENRLTRYEQRFPGPWVKRNDSYCYDGLGRRVYAKQGKTPRCYLYDGLDVLLERLESGQAARRYVRGANFGAGGIGGIISAFDLTGVFEQRYYHYDAGGNVIAQSSPSGVIKNEYAYDAFGNIILNLAAPNSNSYNFSTKEADESGLHYYGARYYHPIIGRWITRDPLGFQDGPNPYVFVRNNPVNMVDGRGLCGEKPWWESFSKYIPSYGHYCSPCLTDPAYRTKPIDSMDSGCFGHDFMWREGKPSQTEESDKMMFYYLLRLPLDPRKWEQPPPDTFKAFGYNLVAQSYFTLRFMYLITDDAIQAGESRINEFIHGLSEY